MADLASKASPAQFRHRRCGIFDVMHEETTSPSLILRVWSLLHGFPAICEKLSHAGRLFTDAAKLAPAAFMAYLVTTVWQGVYAAINLYLLHCVLDTGLGDPHTKMSLSGACQTFAATWCLCVLMNVGAERLHARSLEGLTKRFRAYFMPQLIRASLRVDVLSVQDLHSVFPIDGRFESEFPGGHCLRESSQLLRCFLSLASQVFTLFHTISCKRSPEREALFCFSLARGLVWWMAPSNAINRSGYIYWPNNPHFERMKALFGLAFSTQYRAGLVLDGFASAIETEYNKSARELGDVDVSDPTPWHPECLRPWHWDVLTDLTLDLPMIGYVVILSNRLSPPSIASMVFLQHAIRSISLSIGQYLESRSSLLDVCAHAERLYAAIRYQSAMPRGTAPFPHPDASTAGTKIAFRHVSWRYPGGDTDALQDVSFDIAPGALVLVVGPNGSGKSTLVALLARLFDPTTGSILLDDAPIARYDAEQVRAATTFQPQAPTIYPASVRANIACHGGGEDKDGVGPGAAAVEDAARRAGCGAWVSRLAGGYETPLEPSFDGCRWEEGVYGCPSDALRAVLARHRGRRAAISGGEKQRLATARTLMRIRHRDTRLVVVDEATSALDPIAERDILDEFRSARQGRTMIIVTHRFAHLAREADCILCLQNGRVVGNGTHAELFGANDIYRALYQAQT